MYQPYDVELYLLDPISTNLGFHFTRNPGGLPHLQSSRVASIFRCHVASVLQCPSAFAEAEVVLDLVEVYGAKERDPNSVCLRWTSSFIKVFSENLPIDLNMIMSICLLLFQNVSAS